MTKEEQEWCWTQLDEIAEDLECVDNYRSCEVGDFVGENSYEAQKTDGCCGSIDEEVVNPANGKTYRIGLNYGH